MRGRWLALGWMLALAGSAGLHAQSVPAAASSVHAVDLPAVSVSGVQPGPGLWKVSRDGHVMWVLGLVPAMPAQVQWRSDEVAAAIAGSQELLEPPRASFEVKIGFFGKLFLLPSAYAARKNEDGRHLVDMLPAPLYQRWLALKARFIGRGSGIERWRPIFAAMELEKRARKTYGLASDAGVRKAVDALAEQHGVPRVTADYKVVIEHPRDALKAFRQAGPQDTECFARTLDSVEHDLPAMSARADAWAVGDIDALRHMPDSQARDACVQALSAAGFARQLGVADVPAKVVATWLAAARKALATNRQTFALLPIDELLGPGPYLQALQADGYAIEAPDAEPPEPGEAAPAPPSSGG
ncbi:TraB/GumN family protein [Frateuria sp.]|uniref:TraB/GumN family protein n=1 Tax=Frateuria sp. TaxID=2211372 RepID=UPI0017A95C39|nr:TraB/GumN family protein [Frateuria sp.]NUR22795.1 TraB/GumN family protein [Frateuria sp.]